MMTDEEFVNNVWKKYNKYVNFNFKDNFLKNFKYRNLQIKRTVKIIYNFVLGLIITSSVVYAGISSYKFIQKATTTNFNKNNGYDYNQNMSYSNGIYYKKIYTYEEYVKSQKIWDSLIQMKPEEFNDSFIIVLAGENYDTTSLYVSNIYTEGKKLYIELKKKDIWNENDTAISLKIPKEQDREKIEIKNLPNEISTLNKYVDINSITKNYTVKDAIKDNCFVIENNKIVSKDKKQLDNFIENCNKNINDMIRIYTAGDKTISICDIEYKNKRINLVEKSFNFYINEETKYYCTGNKILKRQDNTFKDITYTLRDEFGNGTILCIINF